MNSNTNKYTDLTKEQLLDIIERQEKDLKNPKKYGLFWDKEKIPEKVVTDCENNLPILKRVKGKEIKTNNNADNILIEGDNYHALQVLNYTHRGKIDVIYIDPPYNTGAKDWKYNNDYVDKEDGYRHSKWLNMMEKRLRLAKKMLTKNGVLVCAIDENELFNIGVLLRSEFSHLKYEVHPICVVHNPRGVQGKNFSYLNEYLLFVVPRGKQAIKNLKIDEENIKWSKFINWGTESLRTDAKNCFYSINIDKNTLEIIGFGEVCEADFHPKNNEIKADSIEIYPIDSESIERKWRYARQSVQDIRHLLKVVKNNSGFYDIQLGKNFKKVSTVWDDKKYDANENGSKLLRQILKVKNFDYPKSLYAVLDTIDITSKKDSTILDFFAGSGTTGHAVLELNKQDGGNRKFILCTNNENNICEEVTYPRVEKVINGYKFKGKNKTIIYEKKLTFSNLYKNIKRKTIESNEEYSNRKNNELAKNISSVYQEIDEIIEREKVKYDKVEKKFEDNTIKIIGIENTKDFKEGLGSNLKYFKTDFIKKTSNKDQLKINLTKKCTEMLCVKENIFNLNIKSNDYKLFVSNDKQAHLCIYYNFLEKSFGDFIKKISKLKGCKKVYIFALNNRIDKEEFKGIKDITFEAIPYKILEVYEQLVKLSKK